MLVKLKVKNFALIEDLEIEFFKGLSSFIGETGAGKSVILKSLEMLFGRRSDQTLIRHESTYALVEGFFIMPKNITNQFDLEEKVKIKRIFETNGKNTLYINDQVQTLNFLKELMKNYSDIHRQEDTRLLEDEIFYLEMIDEVDLSKINILKDKYLIEKVKYDELINKEKKINSDYEKAKEEIEFRKYQIEELSKLNLKVDEDLEIKEKLDKLTHYDKYKLLLENIIQLDNNNLSSSLYDLFKNIKDLSLIDQKYDNYLDLVENNYYEILELLNIIKSDYHHLDYDEDELNYLQERTYEINKIEKKYHKSLNELISYLDNLTYQNDLFTDFEQTKKDLKIKISEQKTKLLNAGRKLTNLRKNLSLILEKDLINELKDLNLDKAKINFNILEVDEFLSTGINKVEFLISLNEGEPLMQVDKVASGGERQRLMLSLKSRYAKDNNLSLLIFDEIDTGVSGITASKVASKLLTLSKNLQIITITHLPQVASKSNYIYHIYKEYENGRMTTKIKNLNNDEKILKIANMLSDGNITEHAINQAKVMLEK